MKYLKIKNKCKKEGKLAILPGWKGYFKWDYNSNLFIFYNGEYRLDECLLNEKVSHRDDFILII